MGNPYTSTTVSGYNDNPPVDNGASTEANRVKWATVKTKIGDPLNTFAGAVNTSINTAFGRVVGGAGITSTAISYTVVAGDQGKIVRATASGITITTPSAGTVGAPFVFFVLNDSSGDITVDGSGAQTIDGDANVTIPSGGGLMLNTDGSNWFSSGQNFNRTQVAPQGYLTLLNTATSPISPIVTSDISAATAVYYRPHKGNLVPISNGTVLSPRTFSELTLTLAAQHLANSIYDVFIWSESGTLTIGTGPAWTTVTAGSGSRGTGAGTTELTLLQGQLVNNVQITTRNGANTFTVAANTATYVGSIFMDGTNGQISCHVSFGQSRKWGVWNAYNRSKIVLLGGDSTASWTYAVNTIRQSNAAAGNTVAVFAGLAEERFDIQFQQEISVAVNGSTCNGRIGIGVNSTVAFAGTQGMHEEDDATAAAAGGRGSPVARHIIAPAIGIQNVNMLERAPSTNTATFVGTQNSMLMTAEWLG